MTDFDQGEAKAVYEISKLTSSTKQIMDDFTNAAVLAMFKEFILTFKSPEEALARFMSEWQKNIITQKESELEALSNQQNSMIDMVVGQKISEQEDLRAYTDEVYYVKDIIVESLINSIRWGITMNKIRCTECGEELISTHRHDFVSCSCPNGAFVDGGDVYLRLGAKDLSKVEIWNEKKRKFEKTVI